MILAWKTSNVVRMNLPPKKNKQKLIPWSNHWDLRRQIIKLDQKINEKRMEMGEIKKRSDKNFVKDYAAAEKGVNATIRPTECAETTIDRSRPRKPQIIKCGRPQLPTMIH